MRPCRPTEVHLDRPVETCRVETHEQVIVGDPGVVDGDGEGADLGRPLDRGRHGVLIGHIDVDRFSRSLAVFDDLFGGGGVPAVADENVEPIGS
jgi:hypothetical protein